MEGFWRNRHAHTERVDDANNFRGPIQVAAAHGHVQSENCEDGLYNGNDSGNDRQRVDAQR